MTNRPPQISDAPGLQWRVTKHGWQARWKARTDLVAAGYKFKTFRLWSSTAKYREPLPASILYIQDQCQKLQADMLAWSRGGTPKLPAVYDGTWDSLIASYRGDPISNYHKVRYRTRIFYDTLCRRISKDHGSEKVEDFRVRHAIEWHDIWSRGGHIALAHSLMGMVRTLVNFGADFLEHEECERVSGVLHRRKFKQSKPRDAVLSADQVIAVRAKAHEQGRHSMALAQAFQFDCTFRQKDVIGEWIPISEPGISDVTRGNDKWLRGIRWEEIDDNLVLRHITSKREKPVEIDLKLATMVLEELALCFGLVGFDRSTLPARGPIVVAEITQAPWSGHEFRRVWRKVATAAGVPKGVRNMDSRAGAITEGLQSGARLQSVRKAATHSTEAMTQRYSRADAQEIAEVMELRAKNRKRT